MRRDPAPIHAVHRLVRGFAAGLAAVLAAALFSIVCGTAAPSGARSTAELEWLWSAADWVQRNLGLSVPFFVVVLGCYLYSLMSLRRRLAEPRPVHEVAQAEHLTDIWISLFFGIGVIWTAIGMRGALLYALGDVEVAGQHNGFEILRRLVDGGILVALSTTIVGGVGGYLMRVFKALAVGGALKRFYGQVARAQGADIQAILRRIERRLEAVGEPLDGTVRATQDDQFTLAP